MIHRTISCRGLKTEVPKGVAQQYVAQHPPSQGYRDGQQKAMLVHSVKFVHGPQQGIAAGFPGLELRYSPNQFNRRTARGSPVETPPRPLSRPGDGTRFPCGVSEK